MIEVTDKSVTQANGAKVTSVEFVNMEVEETHAFAVSGGLIVHNCADETRYRLLRPKPSVPRNVEFRI